jgi:hypothetical protein
MVTINNKKLLDKAGLEAITDEEGNVTIQKKEEVLENGGKWMPKEGSRYFVMYEDGILSKAYDFFNFEPRGAFEKRNLRNGVVFPTKEMAERVVTKYVNAIKEEWDEYEKKINALNRENDERKD